MEIIITLIVIFFLFAMFSPKHSSSSIDIDSTVPQDPGDDFEDY